ncbi:MAG: hypothetical protein JW744_03095, partial [Candidatus Diapherotrites archaeon]|nr:hypothetical protein [Candidatus Diapherotrites archaeon]
ETGQIPNAVDLWDRSRKKQVTFATLDSTLWYLLGLKAYAKAYRDSSLFKRHKAMADKAFFWLKCQDSGEDSLPEQLPTSDWEDCFPHKYGHTISTIALYHASLNAYGKGKLAKQVKATATGKSKFDINLFDEKLGYFLPWQWKNHDGIREQETWFDSLGNAIAICGGLASKKMSGRILQHIEEKGINKPFPVRALYPPIKRGSREWQPYFANCLAARPNWYINGGIWPFVGGFYVAALVKARQFEKAEGELEKLAMANRLGARSKWDFSEWVHPTKRQALGSEDQAWSAGSYLMAFSAVSKKRFTLF